MFDRSFWREGFEELARLPPPPEAPWGRPASLRVVQPGRGYVRMRRWRWAISTVVALAAILLSMFGIEFIDFGDFGRFIHRIILPFEILALVILPVQAAVSFVLLHLDAHYRWYLLTDESLRLREGLWTVREMTISLPNIQHVGLRQGPFERLFGVANVEVRTAGGGSREAGEDVETCLHIGLLSGVEHAESVRDDIVARWRAARREADVAPESPPDDPLLALRDVGRVLEAAARAMGDAVRRSATDATHEARVEVREVGTAEQRQGGP